MYSDSDGTMKEKMVEIYIKDQNDNKLYETKYILNPLRPNHIQICSHVASMVVFYKKIYTTTHQ